MRRWRRWEPRLKLPRAGCRPCGGRAHTPLSSSGQRRHSPPPLTAPPSLCVCGTPAPRAGRRPKRESLSTSLRTGRAAGAHWWASPIPIKECAMRRSSIVGAAAVAALAAGSARRHQRQRLESPRGAADHAATRRADNTDVYAFTAPDAPGQPHDRLELGPVRGPGGRPVLRQARSRGALLRQDRQHRRRRRGRRLPLAVQATRSATRTRSCTRRRRSTRSTTRT